MNKCNESGRLRKGQRFECNPACNAKLGIVYDSRACMNYMLVHMNLYHSDFVNTRPIIRVSLCFVMMMILQPFRNWTCDTRNYLLFSNS